MLGSKLLKPEWEFNKLTPQPMFLPVISMAHTLFPSVLNLRTIILDDFPMDRILMVGLRVK